MNRRKILGVEILEDRNAMSTMASATGALLPAVQATDKVLIGLLKPSAAGALLPAVQTSDGILIGLMPKANDTGLLPAV
jgi:hypothetical protein